MNKKLVISLTFLSIFILIGVGYQPIVADEQIEQISQINELEQSNNKITKFNDLYIRLVKSNLQSNDECNCDNRTTPFDLGCYILNIIGEIIDESIILFFIAYFFPPFELIVIAFIVFVYWPMWDLFNCDDWTPQNSVYGVI